MKHYTVKIETNEGSTIWYNGILKEEADRAERRALASNIDGMVTRVIHQLVDGVRSWAGEWSHPTCGRMAGLRQQFPEGWDEASK